MTEQSQGPTSAPPKEAVIFIDKKQFKTTERSLTGAGIRALPQPAIGADRDLYQEVPGGEDVLIGDADSVALKSGMHFFTTPHTITPGR